MNYPRRQFLSSATALALGARLGAMSFTADADINVGYHVITWGGNVEQAIDDISAVGFHGVQILNTDYQKYADRPTEFKELMAAKKLTPLSISTGQVTLNPATEKQEIADRVTMAKWMKEVGGLYLQATDGARVKQGVNDPDDHKRLGKRLTEIGKRTFNEHGIKLGYHNHMNTLGETHGDVDRIMNATDGRYVWMLPDIAHLQASGGDPVRFVRDYVNRLAYPHFKDVIVQKAGPAGLDGRPSQPKYDFVELGQGQVNIPGVLQIMKDYRYKGWIIVELDRPVRGRTPKESALLSKRYIEERLRLRG